MLGPYEAEASNPESPLHGSYAVFPSRGCGARRPPFVDGHAWVMPRAERSQEERAAIARFLGFLSRYNYDWSRTGQLPAFQAVIDTPQFKALPHRADIAALASTGEQLPDYVERQSAVQGLIGEELEAAVTGIKPSPRRSPMRSGA
jgi:multiple sugar transport system substrate-binding protein